MELMIGRRQLVKASALLLASLAAGRTAFSAEARMKEEVEVVSPGEDLMREHGILRRVLLIYRNFLGKLDGEAEVPWGKVADAAGIVRSFIEDYHEKLEERYVFPAMRKADKLTDLVGVLIEQHQAGRRLTDMVTKIAKRQGRQQEDRKRTSTALDQFIKMYEPHAAREDTVLFPQLHVVWGSKEFEKMGDVFEREEDRLFGDDGFEKMVGRVAVIEKELGIYDLNKVTPGR
ncbi:MAG: hemerythrin domain-containing protein [Syntrophorhabdaceae bacterium]|nr:hemerythrin domain-containing protein [Syntrophorhabdaceae bacterium]MDD4194982.1 hemerythrin domain-containing protein [Syntrophorhabdaceae bacterium]